ncbi:hypothetical protein [Hymenobacter weizhouensis]|nr:hypothetical protein [Hymenobacter sp. YIM 151500-1]UYZ61770.1 hypothetical protein OIS53_12235 [Hymenobacter sp. YIM 151500-1]
MSLGIKAPLNYSVWAAAGCALLLAAAPTYPWSVDAWRAAGPKRLGGSS